jgi:hypothetical protein
MVASDSEKSDLNNGRPDCACVGTELTEIDLKTI